MLTPRSFQNVKPKAVTVSPETLVRLEAGAVRQLPLVLQPGVAGVDLVDWTRARVEVIEAILAQHGALLFRNFSISGIAQFEECARALIPDLIEYSERSSPRTRLSAGTYSSTDHPPDQPIVRKVVAPTASMTAAASEAASPTFRPGSAVDNP